ncbi:hypothetical protein [Streptococcus himalayensis]|uniref:Uncharacterized protein n=1 Tax=Streptococcus himalayensis TaxID=1888195 RepID=A0A917A4E4_9STRE|nr:hypothetical protein [Streptococcus himalayensis]QBX25359.1 hypothetical protein Javan254_0004 [Streptococcus phage Javan254]GGE26232.1 hypothetical protein GCM10011510_04230 [Streptococcus himalayensis]
MPWVTDSVLVAIVTVSGGIFGTLITAIFNRKSDETKVQQKQIIERLDTIDQTTKEIQEIALKTQDGTKKIQRYRLFHDLQVEILQGHTTIERFRELSILFESYQTLGGNGEIEALYEMYKKIPIVED